MTHILGMSSFGKAAMQAQINFHTISLDHVLIKFLFKGNERVDDSNLNAQVSDANLKDADFHIEIERSPHDNLNANDTMIELEIMMRPA